jgi:hypothetical protein
LSPELLPSAAASPIHPIAVERFAGERGAGEDKEVLENLLRRSKVR